MLPLSLARQNRGVARDSILPREEKRRHRRRTPKSLIAILLLFSLRCERAESVQHDPMDAEA